MAILKSEPMLVVEIVPDKKEKTEDSGATEKAEADETGKESAKTGKKGKR